MLFVSSENLKIGMRLAKPIFNRKGVMLYDRNSKLTSQSIASIRNFGIIGIYILEPAEPVPPMTEEDREFERFQTMSVFTLQEIMQDIKDGRNPKKLNKLVAEILAIFGTYQGKITFHQNIRSAEDNVYKHSLNTAILTACISGKLSFSMIQQQNMVTAALLHDIGSLSLPSIIMRKPTQELTDDENLLINQYRENGYHMIKENCSLDATVMKYMSAIIRELKNMNSIRTLENTPLETEVLKAAYMYDTLTAMKYGEDPKSDIAAYRYLRHPRTRMNQMVVTALTRAINIVPVGCSVQFENGAKGIVLTENEEDILRPFVLNFSNNKIYNLADGKTYEKFQIKDVLKTLDNRYIMMDLYTKYVKQLAEGTVE